MSSFEWTVARRYLFSRERKTLVSLITLIAMAGVAVGVAALITVIGVIEGADQLLYGKIADLYPHLRLTSPSGEELKIDPALIARLRARPDVLFAEPIIQKQALVQAGNGGEAQKQGVQLIGADTLGPHSIYDIPVSKTGEAIRLGSREVLIGGPLSAQIGAWPDSTVTLIATNPIKTAIAPMFKSTRMQVLGYFNTGFFDFDIRTAFVSNDEIRRLFRVREGYADYIHVKLKTPFRADAIKRELIAQDAADPARALKIGRDYAITTWAEENGEFFGALKLEKLGLFLILLLIILVAALNIVGTLILMVIEKTREVGILRAVGASERLIARIFLLDGMIIGLVGTALGLAGGIALCLAIPMIRIDLPAMIYNMQHLPVKIRPGTVSLIVLASMAICTLAALFPARQAAKLNPVEALRYD